MKNAIEDVLLMGLGAARITRKRVEKAVSAFVKSRAINNKQAKQIIGKVMKEANKVQQALKAEGKKELRGISSKIKSAGKKAAGTVSKGAKKIIKKAVKRGMSL